RRPGLGAVPGDPHPGGVGDPARVRGAARGGQPGTGDALRGLAFPAPPPGARRGRGSRRTAAAAARARPCGTRRGGARPGRTARPSRRGDPGRGGRRRRGDRPVRRRRGRAGRSLRGRHRHRPDRLVHRASRHRRRLDAGRHAGPGLAAGERLGRAPRPAEPAPLPPHAQRRPRRGPGHGRPRTAPLPGGGTARPAAAEEHRPAPHPLRLSAPPRFWAPAPPQGPQVTTVNVRFRVRLADMSSFAEARIDLDAISGNIALLAERAAGALVMGVVKADGYGHGMIPAARAALAGGATWLGTAFIAEALRLRAAGIDAPVLAWLVPPGEPLTEAIDAG